MTDRSKLLALAEAVEKLTGPDREVDAAIAAGCRHALPKGGEWASKFPKWEGAPNSSGEVRIIGNVNGNGDYIAGTFRSPAYTASLDAAMTLVPEGCWDDMEVYRPDHQSLGWTVHLLPNGNFTVANSYVGFGASFSLALCAAALRAQAEALA